MKKFMLVFTLLINPAFAEDVFDVRTVSFKPAQNECVGRNNGALCVVDTLIACVLRNDESLCKSIGIAKKDFSDSLSEWASSKKDYVYRPLSITMNKYNGVCSVPDFKTCIENPKTGKLEKVDFVVVTDTKLNVFMRRDKNGKIFVVSANEFRCFSDEDCT